MSGWRRIISGTFMAGLSSVLLLGSILLSYAENGYALASDLTSVQTITAVPEVALASGMPYAENITPGSRPTDTPTFTPNPACIPPEGYVIYIVRPGDTLQSLARTYMTSENAILQASCIETAGLSPMSLVGGSVLYVPELHPTKPVFSCVGAAPYGWPLYQVKAGDNLFSLALVTRTTVPELQAANCLGSSTYIYTGQWLYVPCLPYAPPVPPPVFPPTVTPSATATPTDSNIPFVPPSWTPVTPATNSVAAPTATSSSTPEATATDGPSPTTSNVPVLEQPTKTPIPPATDTPLPPPSNTPVPPPSNTPVPPPSNTPIPPPTDSSIDEPNEGAPSLPEATGDLGLYLRPRYWTLVVV
jgi:LysM repeat protein